MAPTPLDELFAELIARVFAGQLHVRERPLLRYLVGLLSRFAHRDELYAVRDAAGRPLEEVAAMLQEGDVLLAARSFERERQVHKQVGDFTLFVTGLWPERPALIRQSGRADALLDYSRCGKESYYLASTFEQEPYRDEAPVLRQLSAEYEICQFGLRLVRAELDRLGRPAAH